MSEKMSKKQAPGFISRAMFWWMFPLYYWGCKRDLDDHDMVPAPKEYNSKVVGDLLERKWLEEEAAAKLSSKTPSLLKVIFKSFSRDLIRGSLFQSIHIAIRTVIPLIFAELLSFWSGSTSSRELAAWYAAALISLNLLASLSGHHAVLHGIQLGMKIRIALSTLMFRKIMRMDYVTLSETTAGKLVNIMSNDLQRFDRALLFVHFIWVIPFQTAAVFYFGYQQAGYAAVVGLVTVLLITCPFQGVLGKLNGKVRLRTAKKTDERILLMNEIINGIQVIKMYAWEVPFQKMVSERRRAELKEVNTTTLLAVVVIGFLVITERAAIFITILVLVLTDSPITARVIFPLLQFMSTLQFNFSYVLPMLISGMAECRVSLQRVQEFMLFKDRNDLSTSHPAAPLFRSLSNQPDKSGVLPLSYQHKSDAVANPFSTLERMRRSRRSLSCGGAAATLRGVCVTCGGGLVLTDVSITVPEGKLCAIIGAVGSGKSSILQVLLRELPTASGSVVVGGRVSFASQEPWLFASSVRDNILFGTPLDIAKYKELHKIQVCKACALDKDFKQLPYGDQTLVGERGATLSGGQRARVNLARAVYREADIYLLDDPLSAVDANVGRQIFEGCVNGYLRTRTRVLVTHQIHFLKAADIIVVMNEGKVQSTGIYQTLSTSDDLFKEILQSTEQGKNRDVECFTAANCEKESGRLLSQCVSTEELPEHNVQAMEAEQRQSGELLMKMISAYFSAGGSWCYVVWVMFLALLPMIAASAFDYFISFWTNQMSLFEDKFDHLDVNMGLEVHVGPLTTCQYLIILGLMVLCCFLLLMTRVHPFARLSSTASANLHDRMFTSMLTGVMRFFDTSSSGRILNRFTKDTGAVDEVLPQSLMQMIQIFICLGTVLMLNAITLYYTLIPSSVLVVIFVFTVRIFIQFSTGVKRIEGTSKSPVFSMVTSSLNGMTTIRSTNSQNRLIEEFDVLQDAHTAAYNSFLGGQCGFGFYLDILCISYLGIILYVFLYIDFGDVVTAGSVGLVVTQTSMLISMLQHGAKMLAAFVGQITSVERMLEYTAIETEDNLFKGDIPINQNWPSKGRIVFENVSLTYSPEKDPVLKKLNVTFESAWKVGIVGRTGAGKSSLISALFRFAYINGKITIDGVDTSLVAKQELRSKISIIPQEPVLFSATVRYNLDPFGNYSDEQLWRALEQVDMKLAVTSLDYKVTKGGTNFSLGQRQLLCLARALLKSNKILIMDEATANVDPQTDSFVQQTIRREFSSCTVLTIAHRLNTIMDSDRVLVMSAGEILEFDHPYILLSDADSHFSSMVQETGRNSSCNLYQIASDSYFQSYLRDEHMSDLLGWQHLNRR